MEYQVIARKWRPRKFSEVVGQDHIIKTLQNELVQGRTAHAYLFVGPRGIGKTSIARIFAKGLNCKKAPIADPCGVCDSCVSINNGNSFDVIEIDGASNNSVDNIRALREEVAYMPALGKYKIYIIDEVHMLTAQAWNALLKTVEEPPPHIKFLFATTEAHKVLPTIVSRCQRFDLRRISMPVISKTLKKITEAEKVRISDSALDAIARAADGGMRDAQSILDQMISFLSGDDTEVSEELVLELFGLTSYSEMESLTVAILGNDCGAVVECIHKLAMQGKNLEKLYEEILSFLRSVHISKIVQNPEIILELDTEGVNIFRNAGKGIQPGRLQLLIETLSSSSRSLYDAVNKQISLESIILKAMRAAHSMKIEDLIARIQQLRGNGELDKLQQIQIAPPALPPPPPAKVHKESKTVHEEHKTVEAPKKTETKPVHSEPVEKISPPAETTPKKTAEKTDDGTRISEKHSDYHGKTFTAETLWDALASEMGKISHPLTRTYMQEGTPKSLSDDCLTVLFDEEHEHLHVKKLRDEMAALNNSLRRLTGEKKISLEIKVQKGVSEPAQSSVHKDENQLKKESQDNPFIQGVLELFEGRIVEVRGA